MVAWAVTGNPHNGAPSASMPSTTAATTTAGGGKAPVPVSAPPSGPSPASLHLLMEHMQRGAAVAAAATLAVRPTHDTLAADVKALTRQAHTALEQLEKDLELEARGWGFRGFEG